MAKPCNLNRILKQFNFFILKYNFPMRYISWKYKSSPMVPQSTANILIQDNINISTLILHGQERLPGYVHLFIVPTKSACRNHSLLHKEIHNIKQ